MTTSYILITCTFRPGESSQPIWLDDITCHKSDLCLDSCQSCPSQEYHDCSHSEDVTLECSMLGINGIFDDIFQVTISFLLIQRMIHALALLLLPLQDQVKEQ